MNTSEFLADKVMDGYNAAILAYGQTGAGKTFTLLGPGYDNANHIGRVKDPNVRGIAPRMLQTIFNKVYTTYDEGVTYDIRFSYLEIYNEKIQDCLSTAKDNLKVYKNENNGLWITDATKVPVKNTGEVLKLMEQGSRNRATAATNSNKESSRSHALLVVTIMKQMKKSGKKRTAQLYMVDLCGSEKVAKTGAEQQRLKEAQNINKSLLSLGNVIAALAEKSKYIPYRDSKLTRLLQNCFGGNSYTSLILCCSSNSYNSTESLSTLRFGDRANLVHNKPKINQTESTVELKRMLGEANYKVHNLQKVVKDLTTNNSQLENLVQQLYSALDAQNMRVF